MVIWMGEIGLIWVGLIRFGLVWFDTIRGRWIDKVWFELGRKFQLDAWLRTLLLPTCHCIPHTATLRHPSTLTKPVRAYT